MVNPSAPAGPPRLASLDWFRGFAILGMVLANYLAGIRWIPAWLKHAPDVGLTVIDLVAPFFIFAIGLTFGEAFERRRAKLGWLGAGRGMAGKALTILGLGALISAGQIALNIETNGIAWGVLQAIGTAELLALAVIRLPAWGRAAAGLGLLAVYQVLLELGWKAGVLAAPHGGLAGSLGWAAMLILATALADLLAAGRRRGFGGAAVLLSLGGLLLAAWFPISKNQISASYVLLSLGASGLLFGAFDWLERHWPAAGARLGLLAAWGRRPMLLYVLHLLLLGLVVLPGVPGWYAEAPAWLAALQAAALLGLLSAAAIHLKP